MKTATREYVLVTAARNEEKYIEKTIQAVVNQTILPLKWVIVSDRSTDKTDEIIRKYADRYSFIQLVRNDGDDQRNFGSQVKAIKRGCHFLSSLKYDFIGNLDADIVFEPDYYNSILLEFDMNDKLGLAGGFVYEGAKEDSPKAHTISLMAVPHAIQLFRREVFEQIGGYLELKYGGPDWHAEVMVRMNGWEVKSFTHIPVYHLKPLLSGEGIKNGATRQGRMDYSLGVHPLFQILKCIHRIFFSKPFFLYAFYRYRGFITGYLCKEERLVSKEFIRFLRKEQLERIFKLQS